MVRVGALEILGTVDGGLKTGVGTLLRSLRSRRWQHPRGLSGGGAYTIFSRTRPLGASDWLGLVHILQGRRAVAAILHPLLVLDGIVIEWGGAWVHLHEAVRVEGIEQTVFEREGLDIVEPGSTHVEVKE